MGQVGARYAPGVACREGVVKVLLTNDDGVGAAGLAAVREQLIALGVSVVTIAPAGDCSGFARRCTFNRALEVRRLQGGTQPVFSCDGSPTDCVRVGLLGGLAEAVDLVVSGVNHGANLADDVVYSGTVGAGLEAGLLGTAALCLSQQTPTGSFAVNYSEDLSAAAVSYDFGLSAGHGARLAAELVARVPAEPFVLSVNYPTRLRDPVVRLTRPGKRAYPRASARPWGAEEVSRRLYAFGAPDEVLAEPDRGEGTDLDALRRGSISVTPLAFANVAADLAPHLSAVLTDRSVLRAVLPPSSGDS
jgi:5'-nucleotidase